MNDLRPHNDSRKKGLNHTKNLDGISLLRNYNPDRKLTPEQQDVLDGFYRCQPKSTPLRKFQREALISIYNPERHQEVFECEKLKINGRPTNTKDPHIEPKWAVTSDMIRQDGTIKSAAIGGVTTELSGSELSRVIDIYLRESNPRTIELERPTFPRRPPMDPPMAQLVGLVGERIKERNEKPIEDTMNDPIVDPIHQPGPTIITKI